jgi:hypothetical protein
MPAYVLKERVFSAHLSLPAGTKVQTAWGHVGSYALVAIATHKGVIRDVASDKLRGPLREKD